MYPNLIYKLGHIEDNAKYINNLCTDHDITLCGVVKGVHSDPEISKTFVRTGISQIGDARIGNLKRLKKLGLDVMLFLTRLPMPSEIHELINHVDISLNSEISTIRQINLLCREKDIHHKIILMCDVGDLREGIMDHETLINAALEIELMSHVELSGIGTNLGCYGSIKPTSTNLGILVELAERIESRIERKLDFISGGATSSLPLLLEGQMPDRINHLRIGEGILLARDLPSLWNVKLEGSRIDTMVIEAQIVELKRKPSHPIGEIFIDAFGGRPQYEDRGYEMRAILALGRQDFVFFDQLIPIDQNVNMIGSSSDHLIVSLPDDTHYSVGDVMQFEMFYGPMLFLSGADHVNITYEY